MILKQYLLGILLLGLVGCQIESQQSFLIEDIQK